MKYTQEDVDQLLEDIAFAEREIQERLMYGEELPEPDIDIVITDEHLITRRRWDTGGTV